MFRGGDAGAEPGPIPRLPSAEGQGGREGAESRRGSRFSETGFPKFSQQVGRGLLTPSLSRIHACIPHSRAPVALAGGGEGVEAQERTPGMFRDGALRFVSLTLLIFFFLLKLNSPRLSPKSTPDTPNLKKKKPKKLNQKTTTTIKKKKKKLKGKKKEKVRGGVKKKLKLIEQIGELFIRFTVV